MLSLVFSLFLIFFLSNISAGLNTTQINNGYSCLQNKTANCSTSLDDNIFTLLSMQTCKSQVLQASSNETCWPKGTCNVKQTAQALLALRESGSSASKAENWLISKNRTTQDIEWYLQIESNEATTCSISYGSANSISISIDADKTIRANGDLGDCLSLAQDNYWLAIAPSPQCQKYEYTISCDKNFITSTLFKKQDSEVINVGEKIHSASSSPSSKGTTTEKINSLCFADGQTCNYEGTLWASLVLNLMDKDVSPYIPYLVTMADSYPGTLPEAFLYMLLGDDYKNDLLLKQKSNQYWEASGNKYYGTALALLALQSDDASTAKTNALDWLGDTQGKNGCWQDNIKNTAFLLYAISPGAGFNGGDGGDDGTGGDGNGDNSTSGLDCEDNGYYCMSIYSCNNNAGGNVLDDYECSSGWNNKCCDKPKQTSTCSEQGGEICSGNEQCVEGTVADASDSGLGECCVGGECVPGGDDGGTENSCETSGGICKSFECGSGEESDTSLDCDAPSEVCCVQAQTSSLTGSLWIWIILALIVLLILMIVFRDGLRRFWLYAKTMFKPSGPSGGGGAHYNSSYFGAPMRRFAPRRILPSAGPTHHGPTPARRAGGELDDVLKKLKDMSR